MNVYELDQKSPLDLRDVLGWSNQASDDVVTVVMALCLHVEMLQREVKALKVQLKEK